jgi:surfactin synthase thioesterase subunit
MAAPSPPVPAAHRWLHPTDPEPEAATRLFLLHHRGGAATAYRHWPALLPSDIACQAVQLPGRQERRHEAPYTRLAPLVRDLAHVLADSLDERPYAVFGHSMGALLGYRVAVEMHRQGLPSPALLAVSGWAPRGFATVPGGGPPEPEAMPAFMARLGSLPAQVGDDPHLLDDAVRAMSADGAVCDDHLDDGAAVDCPVVAYTGREDPLLAPCAMRTWAGRTPEYLGCRQFPGDHFYLNAQTAALTADLVQLLRRYAVTT